MHCDFSRFDFCSRKPATAKRERMDERMDVSKSFSLDMSKGTSSLIVGACNTASAYLFYRSKLAIAIVIQHVLAAIL